MIIKIKKKVFFLQGKNILEFQKIVRKMFYLKNNWYVCSLYIWYEAFFISVVKLLAEIIYHKFLGSVGENDLIM